MKNKNTKIFTHENLNFPPRSIICVNRNQLERKIWKRNLKSQVVRMWKVFGKTCFIVFDVGKMRKTEIFNFKLLELTSESIAGYFSIQNEARNKFSKEFSGFLKKPYKCLAEAFEAFWARSNPKNYHPTLQSGWFLFELWVIRSRIKLMKMCFFW